MDDFSELNNGLRAAKGALDILRSLRDLLPAEAQSDAMQEKIEEAEAALAASEAQLAQAFGYPLCKCDFPPKIMLSKGRHPVHDKEIFECRSCKKQEPSQRHFEQMDRVKAHNEGRAVSSWVNARRGR